MLLGVQTGASFQWWIFFKRLFTPSSILIFGYQLSNIGKIKYNKIQPSSLNIGYYAIENYKKLATKDYDSITSICLSKVN